MDRCQTVSCFISLPASLSEYEMFSVSKAPSLNRVAMWFIYLDQFIKQMSSFYSVVGILSGLTIINYLNN